MVQYILCIYSYVCVMSTQINKATDDHKPKTTGTILNKPAAIAGQVEEVCMYVVCHSLYIPSGIVCAGINYVL